MAGGYWGHTSGILERGRGPSEVILPAANQRAAGGDREGRLWTLYFTEVMVAEVVRRPFGAEDPPSGEALQD